MLEISDLGRIFYVAKKVADLLKLQIYEVEKLYYLCSEKKALISCAVKLICAFVFAYIKSKFSHYSIHQTLQTLRSVASDLGLHMFAQRGSSHNRWHPSAEPSDTPTSHVARIRRKSILPGAVARSI